jgi:tetratricopeptide (TPR) repeat protein
VAGARAQSPQALETPAAPEPSFSEAARQRLWGRTADEAERFEQQRKALLAQAQRELESGQADAAQEALDRAALMRHAADTELVIVRALMAQGQYQRALVACAHTAGAHRYECAGAALYTWLLHLGGQGVVARRLLEEALRRFPADERLVHVQEQLSGDWPQAGPPLRRTPWHAAPWPHGSGAAAAAAARARVIGAATLLGGGTHAVTSRLRLPASSRLWVRNGLGQTVEVRRLVNTTTHAPGDFEPGSAPVAFELLILDEALAPPMWEAAAREPFAGSPAFMVEFAPDSLGRAAWPLLRHGFFAGVPGVPGSRPLGLEAPPGARGGPVFDAYGRLAGIALAAGATSEVPAAMPPAASMAAAGPRSDDRLLSVAHLGRQQPTLVPRAAGTAAATRVGPEVAYELALRGALQVLADGGNT